MKTVLVIGANGGIGSQVVRQLLGDGYDIIGTFSHQSNLTEQFKENVNYHSKQLDISDNNSIKQLANELASENTVLYGVVNCSGIVDFEGKDTDIDIKIWKRTLDINLTGNFLLGKYFYPMIAENGRFIMISSTDAYFGGAITAAYAASKSGVNSLTKSFSLLFSDKKIRVNAIAPGWVMTPMTKPNGKDFLDKVAAINPLKRIASPNDIADLVQFLVSQKSDYINGQTITIDGGYTNQDPTLMLEEETKEK